MKRYEINKDTCVIKYKDGKTKVVENSVSFDIDALPLDIIKYNCEYFGSSFDGRIKGSQNLLGSRYKLPIVVEENMGLVFIPTTSLKNESCSWVNVSNVKKYRKQGKSVLIEFMGGYKTKLPISYFSFENQLFRAFQLRTILNRRKKC